MSNILLIGSLATMLMFTGSLSADSVKPVEVREVTLEADMEIYENLKAIEEEAVMVIVGEATPHAENFVEYESDGTVREFATKRTIKIKKIMKDASEKGFKVGDEIILHEPNAVVKRNGEELRYMKEGYQLMEDGKQYVLFLNPGYVYKEDWVLTSYIQGKYDLNPEDQKKTNSISKKLKEQTDERVIKLNSNIQNQLFKKYAKELKEVTD